MFYNALVGVGNAVLFAVSLCIAVVLAGLIAGVIGSAVISFCRFAWSFVEISEGYGEVVFKDPLSGTVVKISNPCYLNSDYCMQFPITVLISPHLIRIRDYEGDENEYLVKASLFDELEYGSKMMFFWRRGLFTRRIVSVGEPKKSTLKNIFSALMLQEAL